MKTLNISYYTRLIKDLAEHFGPNTELVVHDLRGADPEHSIIAIENGQITGRKVGDGPSHIVIEALRSDPGSLQDRLSYLTRTDDGKILKSSTIYLRDPDGTVTGILGINTDITLTMAMEQYLHSFHTTDSPDAEPEQITTNVAELLDSLIQQSIQLVGKPSALMSKDEKIKAIRFLNDSGAFLITKSGPKVCQVFGISKYTLYSYLDEAKSEG
ncbi:MAG: helix-turn-helix transcriptional regulator [Lachnospiraceae bacterium]|nr:helix-turn-helix transcriptional regulator [Lachnospiraceae bacterium]